MDGEIICQSRRRGDAAGCRAIIEVGRELIEQKKPLGHGNFPALDRCRFWDGKERGKRFINVANVYGTKLPTIGNLAPTALYALAAPSTPPEVHEQIEDRAAKGEKVTPQGRRIRGVLCRPHSRQG